MVTAACFPALDHGQEALAGACQSPKEDFPPQAIAQVLTLQGTNT